MQIKDSIHSTKKFFHKSLRNLKSLFVGGYQRLSKPTPLSPFFSCSSFNLKNKRTNQYYAEFCNQWEYDIEKAMKRKSSSNVVEPAREEDDDASSPDNSLKMAESPLKEKKKKKKKEVEAKEGNKNTKKMSQWRKEANKCSKSLDGEALAQKMKELEMMDASDMEHVLDVEEALHYYSRLKSPVYLDLVDKFFSDMYAEFSTPQPSVSVSSSKRRLGSMRL